MAILTQLKINPADLKKRQILMAREAIAVGLLTSKAQLSNKDWEKIGPVLQKLLKNEAVQKNVTSKVRKSLKG
jgi:hypothetical protein